MRASLAASELVPTAHHIGEFETPLRRYFRDPADALLLYCYHYDPMTGRYGLVIMRVIRLAGLATVLALAAFITVMLRRERRSAQRPSAAAASNGPAPRGARVPGALR